MTRRRRSFLLVVGILYHIVLLKLFTSWNPTEENIRCATKEDTTKTKSSSSSSSSDHGSRYPTDHQSTKTDDEDTNRQHLLRLLGQIDESLWKSQQQEEGIALTAAISEKTKTKDDTEEDDIDWRSLTKLSRSSHIKETSYPQLNSKVSVACLPLVQNRTILWIGGPPGVGKTTIARRFQRYGFMAADCEDKWCGSNLERLQNMTSLASQLATSPFVFGACYSKYLPHVPPPSQAIPVLLLPNFEVYTDRWKSRHPKDKQNHVGRYNESLKISQTYYNNSTTTTTTTTILTIHQSKPESIDETLIRICTAVTNTTQRLNMIMG